VVLAAQAAIALGTISGGWRIIKTMGQKITKLTPIDGFCAKTAAASSIFIATSMGVPVSTTHVITGAISGFGSANRLSAVRWDVTLNIVVAWVLTITAAAIISALLFSVIKLIV
jgi:PiT family inorganic phosphate transporter